MAEGGENNKRELPAAENEPEAKKARVETASPAPPAPLEVDLSKVRRQVEYYLSDDNLKFDKFFHERISANAEGWLPFNNILSCRRIQNLGAQAEHIVSALAESETAETKETAPGEWAVRRKTQAPLPALEERPPRGDNSGRRRGGDGDGKRRGNNRPADLHVGGCIVKISDIPAEASWETLKTKLQERLPRTDQEQKTEDGKRTFLDRAIQFVSTPDSQSCCYALLGKFENDQAFFGNEFAPLEINGAQVGVSLLQDADEASNFIKALPAVIRKRREREIMNRKNSIAKRPILLGGIEWRDMDHLRESLRGVLKSTAPGQTVNAKTKAVLVQLLAYHPNGAAKLHNHADFKVDVMTKDKDSGRDITKCFWVVREDGSTEDFSLQKCFIHMSTNPPFVDKKPAAEETPAVPDAENKTAENKIEEIKQDI
eukprot:Gregarina_sp_Pseudo_9__690@NODE_1439_length_1600_cov_68_094170_g1336_i0_p1_GENE_NODE_1439_length_1600_cov_68_094170_g1336_i0NODE_1439_length_1600_cov_68_094170_g1336_i0_p1_ORF_typecomplete_len429_score175_79DUF3223/PF11523_8/1_6e04DUF3223/PF11523_8/1_7e16La/PF05383_17/1_5e16RRM_3/PF08777_11/0_041_NODE_1439_length_1600_cov_68_094170_g1336_i01861472